MLARYVAVVVFLLIAATSSAQSLKLPSTIFLVAAQTDIATTLYGRSDRSTVEANPLYSHLSPVHAAAFGEAVDAATVYGVTHVLGTHHPKLAMVGLYVMAALRAYAAVHTVQVIQATHARRRPFIPVASIQF